MDEYGTPMQEAYAQGYGDEFTAFVGSLYNTTFKTIRSNRESGFGRYDIMMIPQEREKYPVIIIEFKVCSRMKKETLEEAVQSALNQITEKNYDADLLAQGIPEERIRHYGFAFEGKKVLIGQGKPEG